MRLPTQPRLDAMPLESAAGIAMQVGRPSSDVDAMPIRAPASCSSIRPPGVPVTMTAAGGVGASPSGEYTVAAAPRRIQFALRLTF